MKSSPRWSAILLDLLLLSGLVVIWVAFAPIRIGGQAAYVIVNGISMEPGYHSGDLVITHKAQSYQVGDVVTYRDPEMGAYVIHRIVEDQQSQFILKGDNNSWLDAFHPTQSEIIGRQWIYVPKFGKLMQWLRTPLNLSLATAILGVFLMTDMIIKPTSVQGRKKQTPASEGLLEGAFYLLGFLFLGFLGLSIFAFTQPATRAAENISYQQESNYFYSAAGTPGVYDAETVRSGEPIFPKLTCYLNVGFNYNLLGNQFQNILGSQQMYARILDEQSGWQRTIPMTASSTFTGNSFFAVAPLDLCQLTSLVTMVEKETGLRANAYTVEIVNEIAFTALAEGQTITGTSTPTLVFKFDKVHLYLANTDPNSDPMHITQQGTAANANLEANTISFVGLHLAVNSLRALGGLGLGLSLLGLLFLGWVAISAARKSEEMLIRLRYSSLLMDVYERGLDATLPVIDVTSIDDLARMAERQNTMIMHMRLNFLHFYLVQNNGTLYRYVLSTGKRGIPDKEAIAQEVFGIIPQSGDAVYDVGQLVPWETANQAVETRRYSASSENAAETKMLGRIKL